MKSHFRQLLSLLPSSIERRLYQTYFIEEHRKWLQDGSPLPVSNLSKHNLLLRYQKESKISYLLETGTYFGDTLYALYPAFAELHSVELSSLFYKKALKRFKHLPKVTLHHGDSGKVLHELVPTLKGPAIFWLDGHYSGGLTAKGEKECPVFQELDAIFRSPFLHLIFIDDARLFTGTGDYPTVDELQHFIAQYKPGYKLENKNDCIRVLPE